MSERNDQQGRRTFLKQAAALGAWGIGASRWLAPRGAHAAPLGPLPISIGILLNTFGGSLEAQLDAAKRGGLACGQVTLNSVGLSNLLEKVPSEVCDRIRRAASERKFTVASVDGTFNMCHPDAATRRVGLRRLRAIIEACPSMGTAKVHICTGTRDPDSMWRRHPDNDTPSAWRDMIATVRAATETAAQSKVVLAFEPEVNNVVDSAKKARRLMDEIGSPFLKVTIDPANIFHKGELPRMEEMLDEAFELIGKDIALAHAKDLDHDGDAGHLAAGTGKLDYDRYVSLLHKYHFPGPLMLHGLSESQVPGCVAFLREKISRLS